MRALLIAFLIVFSFSSSIKQQDSLAVTIYNDDFAMVKDIRQISFDKGISDLYFTEVSSNIQTETVTFKALNNPESIRVYEQNFEKNLIDKNSILKKYIDRQVILTVQLGKESHTVSGKLLGYSSGYILQTNEGIEVYNNIAAIKFASLPNGFFTTPTLNWKVSSQEQTQTSCEVAYRTTGFKWKADYSISLNQAENKADIGGWVTIDNNSGKRYIDAKLKLIAGDVNTVKNQPQPIYPRAQFMTTAVGNSVPTFEEKSFADYHLYTLSETVSLNDNSQKQVEFFPKVYSFPIWKYHQIRISSGGYNQNNLDAENKLNFFNSQSNGLGIPFPKGIIRVFKQDQEDNSLQFIGEDKIDHTPKNQNITISTGNAFDIVADKYSEQRQTIGRFGGYRAQMNMTVKNHKQTEAQVIIIYSNNYGDDLDFRWLSNDIELERITSRQYRWKKVLQPDQIWVTKWVENYRR